LRRNATQVFGEIYRVKKYRVSPERQMPERTVKFLSAILTGIVASTALAIPSHAETAAPDDCLLSPKGETPQGSHWYYRIERGSKRHCWYLREGERLSQASPQNILPSARPPAPPAPAVPPANPAPQRSLADAHAELALQQGRGDGLAAAPPAAAVRASETARSDGSAENASPAAALPSRWPDTFGAIPPSSQQPANSDPASRTPPDSTVSPAPVDAAVIPADADSSSPGERGMMPLLVAILGAVTLAGAIIVKLGRPRRLRPRTVRGRRGPIWETTDDDRIVLSDQPAMSAYMRRPRFARNFSETDERKSKPYPRQSRRAQA
jgi:hypothetical protein